MSTNIFFCASMSRELRCQWPMVTPSPFGAKGCAEAEPTATVEKRNSAAISLVIVCLPVSLMVAVDRRLVRTLSPARGVRKAATAQFLVFAGTPAFADDDSA